MSKVSELILGFIEEQRTDATLDEAQREFLEEAIEYELTVGYTPIGLQKLFLLEARNPSHSMSMFKRHFYHNMFALIHESMKK